MRPVLLSLACLSIVLASGCGPPAGTQPATSASSTSEAPAFGQPPLARAPTASSASTVGRDMATFIGYYRTITLTAEQTAVKEAALSTIPAPCCSEFSIATCCCPCNLAKAVWGLAHDLIANRNAGVDDVRTAVTAWLAAANPDGFSGDACFVAGGCDRPVHQNGCGGMNERHIVG